MKIAILCAVQFPFVGSQRYGSFTCAATRDFYGERQCCNNPGKELESKMIPVFWNPAGNYYKSQNECTGYGLTGPAPYSSSAEKPVYDDKECLLNGALDVLPQAGADVTENAQGTMDAAGLKPAGAPATQGGTGTSFWKLGLCPVNVHFYLGSNHKSVGQYEFADDTQNGQVGGVATGPSNSGFGLRRGYRSSGPNKYNPADLKYTTPYSFKYCRNVVVGETYEIQWVYSSMGACNTPFQYQTPFSDGVFCRYLRNSGTLGAGGASINNKQAFANAIGVESQTFIIVNGLHDRSRGFKYYPDLIRGMIRFKSQGQSFTYYTGSLTGGIRNNTWCSSFAPITWHVDRRAHEITAESFDKLCSDMLDQSDDMSADIAPKSARPLPPTDRTANNMVNGGSTFTVVPFSPGARRLGTSPGFQVHSMVYGD